MRLNYFLILCILVFFAGCSKKGKSLSITTMKFSCSYVGDPMGKSHPYFDSLQFFITQSEPDLISFKESDFSENCIIHIKSKGYRFMPLNISQDASFRQISTVAYKITTFEFLASSFIPYNQDSLEFGENWVSWYQLRNKRSGHVFYLFNLHLQKDLNTYQSQLVGFDLLKKIDEISAGVPVILIGDFYNKNMAIKNLLTQKWRNTYPLSAVHSPNNDSDFLVNDFLKIKDSSNNNPNDSIINNVVIQFTINTNKISKNESGAILPELLN